LFAAIGLVAGSASAASGYGFILLFLPYLSSAFVPTQSMPKWLQGFAAHQPITPANETIRALLTGGPIENHALWAVTWCLILIAGAFIWCRVVFHRRSGQR